MKETHYKLKHRVTALFAAAVMLCSMLPGAAFAEEPTPQPTEETVQMEQQTEPSETDNGQTDESSPDPGEDVTEATPETAEEQPAEEEISAAIVGAELYTDLPDAPIGSYIGSEGLPVATGETKIGISEWPESQLEEGGSYLTAVALDNDGLTMAAPLLDGADYAIVPILAQVEYPADGSALDLVLPDGVTLLDYYGAPVENGESLLHNEYSETSAAVLGVYVQADANFTAQLVYTAPDGSTLTKTLQVAIDRNATAEYPFPDSEIAAFAERPTPAVTSGKITKVAKVNGTWLIWFNGEPAYCCTPGADGQPKNCPTYTYVNTSMVGADQYVPGDHYGNQYRIWGGLTQLSLGMQELPPVALSAEAPSLLDSCRTIYTDAQMQIIENATTDSILDAYIDKTYDNEHPKWDFSAETQAIAKTYEINADEIAAYNKTLTAAGENKNGKGNGWQPTGSANEYQLAEIFSNDTGNIRVQGLPYGTYLVVETTVPHDLFQAEPFIVTVDPEQDNNPWGAMATPKDSVMTGSDSYQKFTVLDEEIEVYLRITKVDEETGKPVLLPDTAFQIYWLDEQGHYRYDSNGNPKLVTMTDTVNGHLTKDVTTFYTNGEGILTLPEKLPLGKYRIVEVAGPNGFYNEWLDSAGYENGVLADDADGSYYVDFEITTDRIYAATGDKNENGMDTLVIGENYSNHETLGKLTIRKTGEVLAGWKTEVGALDPWMTGEAEDGNFVYETRPLAGAEYTITAAEDIYTQDRQIDNYGNRTLWYAKGDVVAVVTTGDGSADIATFAPARTKATYDFLSVIHDGTIGEVSVTLPLGSYHIEETKPPYGYIGTIESYDVTFAWDNELNDVVMATSIAKVDGAASSQSFEVVRSKDANADFTEQQTLKFYNDREKAKVGVYKVDSETGNYLAGAVFNLYAADDIYSVDGKLLFAAGELVATSPETGADGYTYFDCDIPIRGEYYGSSIRKDATTNSGKYIVKELRAPLGYYVNEEPMEVTFTYDGQAIMVLDNTCANKPTEMWVSKRDLTNDEELPGATLAIKDTDGNTVTTWVSTDEPHRVTGLHFGESYTLTEIRAADGYALANDITFRLIQKTDEGGNHLEECEVYYLTTKNILFWKWDDWKLLDDATVIMQDDITKVQISKKDLTTNEELPGAELIITDEKGSEIDRWISTDAPHYMEKLPAGKYTLTEVTAPDGYAIAERMEFEVLPNGEVQTFEMFDDTIKVKISKVDITTNEELPGAELVIKDKDGTEIDRWISTNGPHYVEKMPAGDYTLTEITAPNGYKVAESIDFTVLPTGEMQTVVMKDAREDTPTPTPDNTPTPDHTPQPTPNTTPAPTPVPAAPTATPTPLLTIPKTGDNSSLGLLLAIAGISLAGLAVLVHKSARRKDIAPRDDDDEDTED